MCVMYKSVKIPCLKKYSTETLSLKQTEDSFVTAPILTLSLCPFVSCSRITFCHLPFQSKWLYVGTERGNTHIVNIESFILSGYVIMWNKAIEL